MSDRVEDFEPITAEHAELVAGTDETKECGVCGGTTVRIGDARYFRWRGELRISEVWTCEDCRTSGNRLLCRKTGRVVRLSHVHTGSGFETPDAGGELVADGGKLGEMDVYRVVSVNYGANSKTTTWVRAESRLQAKHFVEDLKSLHVVQSSVSRTPPSDATIREVNDGE